MRKYSSLDLIRFGNFWKENSDLKPIDAVKEYNKKYPELSDAEKNKNIKNWLLENDLESEV